MTETSAFASSLPSHRPLGTPLGAHPTRVLFLGSGELGKEVTIELMRLGAWVCAADSYTGAPAQQVANEARVLNMADAARLRALFDEVRPDIIVPEVEAIATGELSDAAARGVQVVPSAEIAAICMDRERLRVLAHEDLGLPTTPYRFAGSLEELRAGAREVGYPCVVKPVMSSSGHGQSVVRGADAIDAAWVEAQEGRRAADEGDVSRVIVEALAQLDYELTVLTVSSSAGVVTCAPIGQRQESGDYRESWQPAAADGEVLERARAIARHRRACGAGDGRRADRREPRHRGRRRRRGGIHRSGECAGRTRHRPADLRQAASAWTPPHGRVAGHRDGRR